MPTLTDGKLPTFISFGPRAAQCVKYNTRYLSLVIFFCVTPCSPFGCTDLRVSVLLKSTLRLQEEVVSGRGRWGSAGAEGAVDASCQVGDGSLFHKLLQELTFSVHVVHLLLLHDAHGQVVVVVQWHVSMGEVVAEACQADLVAEQAGQIQCGGTQGWNVLQKQKHRAKKLNKTNSSTVYMKL